MLQEHEEPALEEKPNTAKIILIVEDDAGIGSYLSQAIAQETLYRPMLVTESEGALESVKHITPDLFILDYRLPHINGIDLYDQLHCIPGLEAIPAIIMSATDSHEKLWNEVAERHLVALPSPHDLDDLLQVLKKLLD